MAGWNWLVTGWRRFVRAPAHWLLATSLIIVICAGLTLVPQVGLLLVAALTPTFLGALLASAGPAGGQPALRRFAATMRQRHTTGRLLLLGLIPCLGSAVLGSVAHSLLGIASGTQIVFGAHDWVINTRPVGAFLFLALMITVMFANWACLLFAIPRVLFAGEAIGNALRASLAAVHDSLGAFLVFVATQALLVILAMMAFGLGLLVLVPVVAGAVIAAHDGVFPAEMAD